MRRLLACALTAGALVLAGCATQTRSLLHSPPAGLPAAVVNDATPYFEQADFHCGPASLAMAISAAGLPSTPDDLAANVFLPGRQGSLQVEMLAATRSRGAVAYRIADRLDALLRELAAGHSVIVLQNLGLAIEPVWHYAVAIGYDLDAGEIVLHSGPDRRLRMPLSTFEHTWDRSDRWAFVALVPGRLPATVDEREAVSALVAFERVAAPAAARAAYSAASERWPDNLALAIGLGNAAYASGDRRAAAAAFRAAAERHGDAAALNNLAVVLDELGETDAALQAARAAAEHPGPWRDAARATLERVRTRQAAGAR